MIVYSLIVLEFKARSNATTCILVKMTLSSSKMQIYASFWVFNKFKKHMSSADLPETY